MTRPGRHVRVTHTLPLSGALGDAAFGGMERHVLDLAAALIDRDIDTEILVLLDEANDQILTRLRAVRSRVPLAVCWLDQSRPWWTGRRRFPLQTAALARVFAARRSRILHLHVGTADYLQLPVASLLCRGIVVSQHSAAPVLANAGWRTAMRLTSPLVDRYIAVSDAVRSCLVDGVGIRSEKVRVVENGIPQFDSSCDQATIRSRLGLPLDAFVVGYVGRLVSMKNVDSLIEAVHRVPGSFLAIVGDGEERASLEARVRALGATNVRFFGYRADSREILRGFDLIALVSDWEGKPLSLIEAMLAGVPTLGSNVPGTSEVLERGEYGLLVPVRDTESLAREFKRAMASHGELAAIAARAQQHSRDLYSSDRMAADMVAIYEEILQR